MRPLRLLSLCLVNAIVLTATQVHAAWEPTQPIEIVVPAGTGGGADQLARKIKAIAAQHRMLKQPIEVVNKPGNSGLEGFQYVKAASGDPHKLVISLSNIFTAPMATGAPFNWRDLTPVSLLAIDEFVLWVNSSSSIANTRDYLAAAKAGTFKMGGTGSKQEDEMITVSIAQKAGVTLGYVPLKGGGDVAAQLIAKQVDSTVNNPIEAVEAWKRGQLRPLCVFNKSRLSHSESLGDRYKVWSRLPTCSEEGLDVSYSMMRAVFAPSGLNKDQLTFYHALFKRIRDTGEWVDFVRDGAFTRSTMTDDEFVRWLEQQERDHKRTMESAGMLKK